VAICPNDAASYPEDSFENMKRFAKAHDFPFPYLHDEIQTVARAYGAVCTPDFFGYNADRKLKYRGRLDEGRISPPRAGAPRELVEAMRAIATTGLAPAGQKASLAIGSGQTGVRHRDLDRSERAGQRSRPAAVAVARNALSSFVAGHGDAPVTWPRKCRLELAAEQFFDELTRSSPHFKPVVEKIADHIGRRLQRIRLRGSARHGVVSSPTLQRRMIRG
jgi:AhpC/TSA family